MFLEYRKAQNKGETLVLATLLRKIGSSYQAVGAKMLIEKKKTLCGTLGGGCVDESLVSQAEEVLQSRTSRIVSYDMEDEKEVVFGFGTGCGGKLEILLEPLPSKGKIDPLEFGEQCWQKEEVGYMALFWREENRNSAPLRMAWCGDEIRTEEGKIKKFYEMLKNKAKRTIALPLPQWEKDGWVLLEAFYPRSLHIFGISPESYALVDFAQPLGWKIKLYDHRKKLLNDEKFAHVEKHFVNWSSVPKKLHLGPYAAVVLATHNYLADRVYLPVLLQSEAFYVGMVSSKRRAKRLLQELGIERKLQKFFSPAGLNLGGKGPVEIALSVISQIQEIWYKSEF